MKSLWEWMKGPYGQLLVTILALVVLFVLARYYRSRENGPRLDHTPSHVNRSQCQSGIQDMQPLF
jgi:hypothetical protein